MAAGREKRVFKTNNPKNSSAKPKSKSAKPKSNSAKPKTISVKPKSKPAIPKIVQVSPSEQNVQPSDNPHPQDEEQVDPSLDQIKRDSLEKSVQIEPEPYEVQRKVCNPCGCCCCKCCTLRVNCMVIAVYGVLSALWWTMVGVKSTLALNHMVALVIILLYGIVTVLTAVSITIAVFRRLKEAALGAFGGWISSAVFFMAFCWTITSFFDDYVQMITSIPVEKQTTKNVAGYVSNVLKIITIVVMVMFVPIKIYFAMCCLQHSKQIKLGVDARQEPRGNNVIRPDTAELPPPPSYSSVHTPQEQ